MHEQCRGWADFYNGCSCAQPRLLLSSPSARSSPQAPDTTADPATRRQRPAQRRGTRRRRQQAHRATAPPAAAGDAASDTVRGDTGIARSIPTAQFIASYDAGRGQRYYLFGTAAAYAELVAYYRAQLRDKGDVVYEQPPTHMFQVGRYREETMAFPPGVTVKDWTWGGSQGYPNREARCRAARFPSDHHDRAGSTRRGADAVEVETRDPWPQVGLVSTSRWHSKNPSAAPINVSSMNRRRDVGPGLPATT